MNHDPDTPGATAAGNDTGASTAPQWPEPVDLLGTLTPSPILRRDMLPDTIAAFASDTAERIGVEMSMVAMPALAVCAGALDDAVRIQPREHDTGWTESARLWVAVVAPPGEGKTPAATAAKKPLKAVEDRWYRDYRKAMAEYDAAKDAYKKDPASAQVPNRPARRRAIVTDATTEAIADILADNPRGLFGDFDELTFLIGGFDAYRGASSRDRPIWLQLWDGGTRSIDRKGKGGSMLIPNWSASIYGGIQTNRLITIASGLVDDGLLQRFLLFAAENTGMGLDRAPDRRAIRRYNTVVSFLSSINPERPAPVRLSDNARPYWDEVMELARKLRGSPTMPGALRNWLSKVSGNFARLLLTFHAIECAAAAKGLDDLSKLWEGRLEPWVSGDTAKRARDLMVEFLIPSAMRLYHLMFPAGEGDGRHARWIAGYILSKRLDKITDRNIYRDYRELSDVTRDLKARGKAMDILAGCGWAVPENPDAAEITSWTVNPLVHERFAQFADGERRRREREREKIAEAARVRRETWGEAMAAAE